MNSRKIQVPEESQSHLLFTDVDEQEEVCLLSSDNTRSDGRNWNDMRPVSINCEVIDNVTGSAYIEMGGTKVVGSIRGPRELGKGEEFTMEGGINCELKFAPFSTKYRKNPKQEQEEKFFSNLIGQALKAATLCERFPKLQVDINLLVLEDCGSVLATAVLCATVAMVTGGIEMKDIPTACKVSFGGEHILCDPTHLEEYAVMSSHTHISPSSSSSISGDVTVIYSPSLEEVTGMYQCGLMDVQLSEKAMEVCIIGCKQLKETIRTFLEQHEDIKCGI